MRGLEERGQLGLTPSPSLQLGPDPQRELLGLVECGELVGSGTARAGEQQRPVVRFGGGTAGEELQVGGLIVGHGHRITCRTGGRTRPVDDEAVVDNLVTH